MNDVLQRTALLKDTFSQHVIFEARNTHRQGDPPEQEWRHSATKERVGSNSPGGLPHGNCMRPHVFSVSKQGEHGRIPKKQ